LPLVNPFHQDFVIDSFVNVIEQLVVGITNQETLLLVGETGTGKTTIVQNISHVLGKKLNVFNMSQNTDSTDLMGGFKPIDIKLLLKPLYVDFLNLFNTLLSEGQNKEFLKVLYETYNQNKNVEFFQCIDHGISSIQNKIKKLKKKNSKDFDLKEISKKFKEIQIEIAETKEKVKKADKSFIFKFIEGKLVQSIKNGEWILLDEINLAPEDVLNKVESIIDKTVLLTERADDDNIPIHPDFRMF
jgi:midasin